MANYIVQSGDTLSRIAQKKLGRASRWTEIVRLNQFPNPNLIFVGQILKLPDACSGVLGAGSSPGNAHLISENGGAPRIPASVALARGFLFVVFEQLPEIGVGKIIRKVAAIPRDFSQLPANSLGNLTPAEHVLNLNPFQSPFLSASNRPFGAPSINGQPLLLDVDKIKKAGGEIYSVADVVGDLEQFAKQHPASRKQVDKLISTIRDIEGEMLVKGGSPPGSAKVPSAAHNAYIQSAEELWAEFTANRMTKVQLQQELANLERAYSQARIMGRVGRVLMVVGVVVTTVDLTRATNRSINQKSLKPLGAEVLRQTGGWGAAIAGGKIGLVTGAAFGVETGPGLIVTGAIGAIVFGAAGYFGADWIADKISPN